MATLRQIFESVLETNPAALDLEVVVDVDGEGWGWDAVMPEVSANAEVLILFTDGNSTEFEYADDTEGYDVDADPEA